MRKHRLHQFQIIEVVIVCLCSCKVHGCEVALLPDLEVEGHPLAPRKGQQVSILAAELGAAEPRSLLEIELVGE